MDKKRIKQDLLCAVLFLIFSVYLVLDAIPGQISVGGGLAAAEQWADSRTFPYFAAWVMGAAALGEAILNAHRYWSLSKEEKAEECHNIQWRWEFRALAVFGLCVAYTVLFDVIGYLPATFLVPPLVLYVMGARKWQHYLSVYAVAIIVYVVFRYVLNVQVP